MAPNEQKNGTTPVDVKDVIVPDDVSEVSKDEDDSKSPSPGKDTTDEEANIGMGKTDENQLEIYKNRLRKELVSRDGHGEIDKDTTLFLSFKDKNLETAYVEYREPFSSVPLSASLLVHLVGVIYALLILPR